MGTSTNAMLFWGFCAPGGESAPMWAKLDEDGYVVADPEGDGDYPDAEERFDRLVGTTDQDYAVRSKRREQAGCEVDSHCSGDYPQYYVCVTASHSLAWRGDPTEIVSLVVGEDWERKLRAYCRLMGIPWQQPRWLLASYWG